MGVIFGFVIAVVLGALIFLWVVPSSSDSGSDSGDWSSYPTPAVIQITPPSAFPAPFATPTP